MILSKITDYSFTGKILALLFTIQIWCKFHKNVIEEKIMVWMQQMFVEIDFKFWYHFSLFFTTVDMCFVLSRAGLISTVRSLQEKNHQN